MTARILVVDDIEANVRLLEARLMAEYFQVLTASNGRDALEICANGQCDIVLLDVMMPDMDGPTLAKHMRQHNPKLKIVFISGYTEDRLKDHMGENIYFLPKPFTLKQLAQKVKEALED